MIIRPYVSFEGRCEAALRFYGEALGARIDSMMRYHENPQPPPGLPAGSGEKIMHAQISIGENTLLASDGLCSGQPTISGMGLTLECDSDEEAQRRFEALLPHGQVLMPLSRTFFASSFGMVKDQFGVQWLVMGPRPSR
jgi:PhnB protein